MKKGFALPLIIGLLSSAIVLVFVIWQYYSPKKPNPALVTTTSPVNNDSKKNLSTEQINTETDNDKNLAECIKKKEDANFFPEKLLGYTLRRSNNKFPAYANYKNEIGIETLSLKIYDRPIDTGPDELLQQIKDEEFILASQKFTLISSADNSDVTSTIFSKFNNYNVSLQIKENLKKRSEGTVKKESKELLKNWVNYLCS